MPYKDLTYGSIEYTAEYSEDSTDGTDGTWTLLVADAGEGGYWLEFYSTNNTLKGTPATAKDSYWVRIVARSNSAQTANNATT